jgi:hypothetical protein
LLHKPIKKLATVLRETPIKTEREFVEVRLKVRGSDCALVGTNQPALDQGDYQMNIVKLLTGILTTCADDVWMMIESRGFEFVINHR